jgi:hypothetical protein
VKVLTDTDGDGKYDDAKSFWMKSVSRGWSLAEGILVTAAPDILYAEDSDGATRPMFAKSSITALGGEPAAPGERAPVGAR